MAPESVLSSVSNRKYIHLNPAVAHQHFYYLFISIQLMNLLQKSAKLFMNLVSVS